MHFLSTLLLLGAAIASVSAGPYLVKPTADDSFNAGKQFTVTWIDNNNAPTAEAFGASTLYIATGSSTQHTNLATLGNTTEVKITVDASWGPDSDLYFILLQSNSGTDSNGIPLQSFSARFSLTKMTGTFSSAVLAQISGVTSGAPVASSTAAASGTSSDMVTTTAPASTGSASAAASNANKAASASASSTSTATSGAAGLRNAGGVVASLALAAGVAAMVC